MICDVHAHYTPKNFSEFMGDRFASPTHLAVKRGLARHPFSDTQEDIEARFRLMEDVGVGRQVLSPTADYWRSPPSAFPNRGRRSRNFARTRRKLSIYEHTLWRLPVRS